MQKKLKFELKQEKEPPQKKKIQGLEDIRERQKTAAERHYTMVGLILQPPTGTWRVRFASPKFLLHCVPQKLHIAAERCAKGRSAKLIVKGNFIENTFLNPAPQERATSVWHTRNE